MKKIVFILCFLSSTLAFGQWNQSSFSSPGGLYEVDFPSENAAYIVGEFGLFYKSTDGGITWSNIYDFGAFTNPYNLQFINADKGFVKIFDSQYRTFDGGISWTEFGEFPKLKIVQNNLFTSFTSNDTTYIIKSTDFGDSWTTLLENYQVGNQPYVLSVVDNSNAFFINPTELDRVYKTTDGFLSTDTVFITTGDIVLQDQFDFKDVQYGYHYGSWGSLSHPTRTWNTGSFYFSIDLDGFGVLPVLDLDFNSSKVYASSLYGNIYYSVNNGQSWTEQATPINEPMYSISFLDNNNGIAIGGNTILYTTNGGFGGVSGIDDLNALVQITPNPTMDILILQNSTSQPIHLKLYNSLGELLIDKIFVNQINTVDLSELANGVYLYNIDIENRSSQSGKIVKQ